MSASYTIQTFAPLAIICGSIAGMGYGIKGLQTLFGYHKQRRDIIQYRFLNNGRDVQALPPYIVEELKEKAIKEGKPFQGIILDDWLDENEKSN
eukprot:CAMPEP_0197522752 /NCGR_PEP_ID=MMETSP1318-20131121/7831_1 /TAXON_ID=552666 /ORGANISM="Partenskyella glossopodia, Strain RCC365" /LENGTH=93 /DNA_ID=CAMNT_0043075219 /DNA_START=55 /DNA_END=336 /DNA_ORIENTATION=+